MTGQLEQVLAFVGRHAGPVIFAVVFLDQLGLPIPTVPILLAFGALAGTGQIDPLWGLVIAISASVAADLTWFQLGRWKGARVLGLLCRVALEPDLCVSKTHRVFERHGLKSLLIAKFVPGLDTVAPPLAGMLGFGVRPFMLWSAAGGLLWLGTFGGLGYLFSDRLEELASAADRLGRTLGLVVAGVIALYLGYKFRARRRVLASVRTARITPDELHALIASGAEPTILDARSPAELQALPFVIERARSLTLEDLDLVTLDVPADSEVVVYCS